MREGVSVYGSDVLTKRSVDGSPVSESTLKCRNRGVVLGEGGERVRSTKGWGKTGEWGREEGIVTPTN